eukprot:jgi/Botrbrau1/7011/Bobra.0165s0040.1
MSIHIQSLENSSMARAWKTALNEPWHISGKWVPRFGSERRSVPEALAVLLGVRSGSYRVLRLAVSACADIYRTATQTPQSSGGLTYGSTAGAGPRFTYAAECFEKLSHEGIYPTWRRQWSSRFLYETHPCAISF